MSSVFEGKNIVVGVCGGIAAYKTCELVRAFVKRGANVDVIMTEHATHFVTPLTLETLSNNPVSVDMFATHAHREVEHVSLAKKADLFVVCPATANIVGKYANGIADDMLSTTLGYDVASCRVPCNEQKHVQQCGIQTKRANA